MRQYSYNIQFKDFRSYTFLKEIKLKKKKIGVTLEQKKEYREKWLIQGGGGDKGMRKTERKRTGCEKDRNRQVKYFRQTGNETQTGCKDTQDIKITRKETQQVRKLGFE